MSAPNYCRACGYGLKFGCVYCPRCGKNVTRIIPAAPLVSINQQVPPQPSTNAVASSSNGVVAHHNSSGAGGVAAVALLLLIIVGGLFLFISMPHGAQSNPFSCVPHEETIYTGSIETISGNTIYISPSDRITQFSYDTGLLTYTIHLTNDQGLQFTYHYVSSANLIPSTIVTGC